MAFDLGNFLKIAVPAAATGVSGYFGYKGATGAAQTQAKAAQDALAFYKRMYANQMSMLSPYTQSGSTALQALMRGMGLAPFTAPPAGGGAYGQESEFGSPLLGNLNVGGPTSALGRTGKAALSGASTGASLGSVVPGIGTAVGAVGGATIGTIGSLFGRGRKEADQLVPTQNAVSTEIDRIMKAVESAKTNGTLTRDQLQQAVDTVNGLKSQFGDVAKKFGRAGPGGAKAIQDYYADPMKAYQGALDDKNYQFAAGQQAAPGGAAPGSEPIAMGYFNEKPDANVLLSQDPGYQARLSEGQKQLDRFFASRGLASSGGAAKSAGRYGQTFASNEYGAAYNRFQQQKTDEFNRLMQLAGMGEWGTGVGVGATGAMGQEGASLITGEGAVRAAGQVGGANAIRDTLTQGANVFNDSMQLRQIQDYLKSNQFNPGAGGRPSDYPWQGPMQPALEAGVDY